MFDRTQWKLRRCKYYNPDGSPRHGGCPRPTIACAFVHPDDREWRDAASVYIGRSRSRSKSRSPSGSGMKAYPSEPRALRDAHNDSAQKPKHTLRLDTASLPPSTSMPPPSSYPPTSSASSRPPPTPSTPKYRPLDTPTIQSIPRASSSSATPTIPPPPSDDPPIPPPPPLPKVPDFWPGAAGEESAATVEDSETTYEERELAWLNRTNLMADHCEAVLKLESIQSEIDFVEGLMKSSYYTAFASKADDPSNSTPNPYQTLQSQYTSLLSQRAAAEKNIEETLEVLVNEDMWPVAPGGKVGSAARKGKEKEKEKTIREDGEASDDEDMDGAEEDVDQNEQLEAQYRDMAAYVLELKKAVEDIQEVLAEISQDKTPRIPQDEDAMAMEVDDAGDKDNDNDNRLQSRGSDVDMIDGDAGEIISHTPTIPVPLPKRSQVLKAIREGSVPVPSPSSSTFTQTHTQMVTQGDSSKPSDPTQKQKSTTPAPIPVPSTSTPEDLAALLSKMSHIESSLLSLQSTLSETDREMVERIEDRVEERLRGGEAGEEEGEEGDGEGGGRLVRAALEVGRMTGEVGKIEGKLVGLLERSGKLDVLLKEARGRNREVWGVAREMEAKLETFTTARTAKRQKILALENALQAHIKATTSPPSTSSSLTLASSPYSPFLRDAILRTIRAKTAPLVEQLRRDLVDMLAKKNEEMYYGLYVKLEKIKKAVKAIWVNVFEPGVGGDLEKTIPPPSQTGVA